MSRIAPLHWKLALPALGLALAAAIHAHAGTGPTAPAAQPKAATHHTDLRSERGDGYALVFDDGQGATMTGNSADWSAIKQLKRSIKGEFLWFRDGGKSWIVQDPDTLAKARAAWAPVNRLGGQMDAYGKEMDRHGKAMEVLGKQMDALGRKMDVLGKQMDVLGKQMDQESDAADKIVRGLILEARARGLAQQAPIQG